MSRSTRLVFHSNEATPPWGFDIYTIDIDGNNRVQITVDPTDLPPDVVYSEFNPSWSPDGSWIIFTSDQNVYSDDIETEMLQSQLHMCDISGDQTMILDTGVIDSNWADW
jgi:Tol biopolymer transport system component